MANPIKAAKIRQYQYSWWYLILPLTLLYIAIIATIVINGFYQNYLHIKTDIQHQASLLAQSASYAQQELVAAQVSASIKQSPYIENVQFYPFDEAIKYDENNADDWRNALINDTVSLNEGVLLPNIEASNVDPNSTVTDTMPPSIEAALLMPSVSKAINQNNADSTANNSLDATLIGYINITINLNKLRRLWLQQNMITLLSLTLLFTALLSVLYWTAYKLLKPLFTLSAQAEYILQQNQYNLSPIIYMDTKSVDIQNISRLFAALDSRYKKMQRELEELQLYRANKTGDDNLSIHRSNYQGMIVHELKSDLTTITDGLTLLSNQYLTEDQVEAVSFVQQGSEKLDFTLNQVIQLNRIEKGQVGIDNHELQPTQLINNIIQDYTAQARKRGIELISRVHHTDHILSGDDKKIRSILAELVSNAIKYTNHGQVIIDSEMSYLVNSVCWQLQVIDTGIGIEKKHLDNIFLPFFQLKPVSMIKTDLTEADTANPKSDITGLLDAKELDAHNTDMSDVSSNKIDTAGSDTVDTAYNHQDQAAKVSIFNVNGLTSETNHEVEAGKKGDGIGLGIAERLTKLLGGELRVKSQVGGGTTFTLILYLQDRYHNKRLNLLKGVHILALEESGLKTSPEDSELQKFANYGATVDLVFDEFTLVEQYQRQLCDVIIVSDNVSLQTLETLCIRIREQETDHRVLIVWCAQYVSPKDLSKLQVAGLDDIIDPHKRDEKQAEHIKHLMGQ